MPMPRKSAKLHWLTGSKSQAQEVPESDFPAGRPRMPKYLPAIAQEKWRELVRLLGKRGTLTKVDSTAMEILCVTYERWRALCDEIRQYGPMVDTVVLDSNGESHTKRVQNPASKLAAQLETSMRAMLKELTATPASREKARPAAPEKPKDPEKTAEEKESEAFAALLDRRR